MVKIDTRLCVAITSPRHLPGGHTVCADKTVYVFQAEGHIGDTYYWKIANAKTLLDTLQRMVESTTITQPDQGMLSEEEVYGFIRDLDRAIREKTA